jgi:hypothetical protein
MNLTLLAPDIQEALLNMTEESEVTEHDVRTVARHVGLVVQRGLYASLASHRHGTPHEQQNHRQAVAACWLVVERKT